MKIYKTLRIPLGFILSFIPFMILAYFVNIILNIKDIRAMQGIAFVCILIYFLNVDNIYYRLNKLNNFIEKKLK
jgi:hypothetical protein